MASSSKKSKSKPYENTNLINFTFCDHKQIMESIILAPSQQDKLVEDVNDFWKFVNKYENMLKKIGQPVLPDPIQISKDNINNFEEFHKRFFINLELTNSERDLETRRYIATKIITPHKIKQFREIILTYLDFKQKEKFAKIRKLRQTQKLLPIYNYKDQIKNSLKDNQVIIIAGDTGCGKSTQVPQYLKEFGFKNIACTQPRRLACISLSKRVAHEMLDDFGNKVGFQIRFEKSKNSLTNIVFITEGLLLRQLALDSNLDQYDVIILDEIHERNLSGDFLLGVTKCLLKARNNLKLVLMSATINVELFQNYFQMENVHLIEVPGRLFPIKTIYIPPASVELKAKHSLKTTKRFDAAPYIQVLNIIDKKYPLTERGDVLIFVSGVKEIETVVDAVQEYSKQSPHWIILPLHSALALAEQDKVFDYAPEGTRKCIISTNIAETSLTVDGIRFVIDSGKVKEMSYDSTCKGQRLKEFWVSKSSAEQRKGRAGRTGPGTCYRIYSEEQFNTLEPYPTPEIHRVPLENILLQMIAMGLPNVRHFPFIESPPTESIEQTILSLKQHVALTFDEKITPLGKALSSLPVEISIGKMLLMGCVFIDAQKILTVASVMSVQSPLTNRAYNDLKCENERKDLESDQGDIFLLLNAYYQWLEYKCYKSENTKKWCLKLGFEEQRFYEIAKLRNQFHNILESSNMLICTENVEQSSSDRSRRHGEIRNLKALKRAHKFQEPRKRKLLSRNEASHEDFDDNVKDIRDVDFHLTHDAHRLEVLLNSANVRLHKDILLLKLIIVSGFYPQVAIPDDYNFCKGGTQQFFHTILKPFASIHPNSQFAKSFEILKLNDSDILEKPSYYTPKVPLSSAHQILCYQTLLETTKPYIVNSLRMPAAQTLLLFSFTIDTNVSITRIVCDSWLCLEFPVPDTGIELLVRASKLRRTWANMLSNKLNELSNQNEIKKNENDFRIQTQLWEDLIAFMNINVSYTLKRLLPADLKNLYTLFKMDCDILSVNLFAQDFKVTENLEKGGLNVSENIVYGCLNEVPWTINMDALMKEQLWKCEFCGIEIPINCIEKFIHKVSCRTEESKNKINYDDLPKNLSKNRKKYSCEVCGRDLYLSQIDILKHINLCKKKRK